MLHHSNDLGLKVWSMMNIDRNQSIFPQEKLRRMEMRLRRLLKSRYKSRNARLGCKPVKYRSYFEVTENETQSNSTVHTVTQNLCRCGSCFERSYAMVSSFVNCERSFYLDSSLRCFGPRFPELVQRNCFRKGPNVELLGILHPALIYGRLQFMDTVAYYDRTRYVYPVSVLRASFHKVFYD
jgi:hypothetical protein